MPRASSVSHTMLYTPVKCFKSQTESLSTSIYLCIYRYINQSKKSDPLTYSSETSCQAEQSCDCNNKTWVLSHSLESELLVLDEHLLSSRGEFSLCEFITKWGLHKPTTVQNPNELMGDKLICPDVRNISLGSSKSLVCARASHFRAFTQSIWDSSPLLFLLQAWSSTFYFLRSLRSQKAISFWKPLWKWLIIE